MSDLVGYYERLLEVAKNDADLMLTEEDVSKRSHKQIKALLDMAVECEKIIDSYESTDADWATLSAEARQKILAIIEEDRNAADE